MLQLEAAAFGVVCEPDAYSNVNTISLTFEQTVSNLTLCEAGDTDVFEIELPSVDSYTFELFPLNGDVLSCIEPFIDVSFSRDSSPVSFQKFLNGASITFISGLMPSGTLEITIQSNQTVACPYSVQFYAIEA